MYTYIHTYIHIYIYIYIVAFRPLPTARTAKVCAADRAHFFLRRSAAVRRRAPLLPTSKFDVGRSIISIHIPNMCNSILYILMDMIKYNIIRKLVWLCGGVPPLSGLERGLGSGA